MRREGKSWSSSSRRRESRRNKRKRRNLSQLPSRTPSRPLENLLSITRPFRLVERMESIRSRDDSKGRVGSMTSRNGLNPLVLQFRNLATTPRTRQALLPLRQPREEEPPLRIRRSRKRPNPSSQNSTRKRLGEAFETCSRLSSRT